MAAPRQLTAAPRQLAAAPFGNEQLRPAVSSHFRACCSSRHRCGALPPTEFSRSAAVSAAAVAHTGASLLIPPAALTRARATPAAPAACGEAVAAISLASLQSVGGLGQAALGAQPLARPRVGRLPRWRRVLFVPAVGAHAAGAVPRLRLRLQAQEDRHSIVEIKLKTKASLVVPAAGAHAAGAVPRLQMQWKVLKSRWILHLIGDWCASSQPPACMPPLPYRGCGCQQNKSKSVCNPGGLTWKWGVDQPTHAAAAAKSTNDDTSTGAASVRRGSFQP